MSATEPASPRSVHQGESETPERNPVLWWSTIAGMIAVMLFGAIFVPISYRKLSQDQANDQRPPFLARLVDLNAVNHDGKEVRFAQLEGKIWVAGYQSLDDSPDQAGAASIMKALHGEFGPRPDFHLVSISLDPANETPEKLDGWMKDRELVADNWWFLTGDEQRIRDYMIRSFKFTGIAKNTDPETIAEKGRFTYDRRFALVDRNGMVRGMYPVLESNDTQVGPTPVERLQRDIRFLLEEMDQAKAPGAEAGKSPDQP